jgi:hypothetical protein
VFQPRRTVMKGRFVAIRMVAKESGRPDETPSDLRTPGALPTINPWACMTGEV